MHHKAIFSLLITRWP